jgi:hypothetical protein
MKLLDSAALTQAPWLWSTLINVMDEFSANPKLHTGMRGAVAIPAIRISGHNVRAGNGA